MNEKETKQFFASKPNPPHRIHMGGKAFHLVNLPQKEQDEIKKRIAEKDPIMKKALETTKFGIKIDGKEVGRNNIHDFEIKKPGEISKSGKEYREKHKAEIEKIEKEAKKIKKEIKKPKEAKKYTKAELEAIAESKGLKGLRAIGKKLALKFRSIKEAIKEIMEAQK